MAFISGSRTLGNVVYAGRFPVATGSAFWRAAWYDDFFGTMVDDSVDVRSIAVG
jgi:hypothetical protein